MKVLIIDNYDSFTYNLYHYVQQYTASVEVLRNDAITPEEAGEYSHIVISPGPGLPQQAGCSIAMIEKWHRSKSIFGVCLGHQALAEFSGGRLYNQQWVAHGLQRKVERSGESKLLEGLPQSFEVGLYHSWAVERESLPEEWKVTAVSEKGVIMAMEHRELSLYGVQFHPESVMCESGLEIIGNWLQA